MVLSCRTAQVFPFCTSTKCCRQEDWRILREDNRVSCIHHGYVFVCFIVAVVVNANCNFVKVLDPASKMAYFKKNWPEHLQDKVLACAEKVVHQIVSRVSVHFWPTWKFETRYLEISRSTSTPQSQIKKGKASGLKNLIRQTQSSDEDEEINDSLPTSPPDLTKPWRTDFMNYVDTLEAKIPPGMSTIQWWGVRTHLYSHNFIFPLLLIFPLWRSMHRGMGRCGVQSLGTTCLLWHHPSQVSELFLKVG